MRCSVENWIWIDSFTISYISLALYSNDYAKYVRFINGLKWIVMPHACLPTWHLWLMIIHRKLHSTVMIVFSSSLYLVVCFNMVLNTSIYVVIIIFTAYFQYFWFDIIYFAGVVLTNFIAHTLVPFFIFTPNDQNYPKNSFKDFSENFG